MPLGYLFVIGLQGVLFLECALSREGNSCLLLRASIHSRIHVCRRPKSAEVVQYNATLPGVNAATTIRIIESAPRLPLIIFPSEIVGLPPVAIRLASSAWIERRCSRSTAFMTQFPDSKFAIVRNPRMTGKAIVGSECAKLVKVRKLSEAKGVGS